MSTRTFRIQRYLIFVLLLFTNIDSIHFNSRNLENFVPKERFLETVEPLPACSHGCLKCDTSSGSQKCRICDMQLGFFLISTSCHKIDIPHCLFYSSYGRCAECAENYYLSHSKHCFEIISPVENCLYHSSPFKCRICKSGYITSNGTTCVQLQAKIRGCDIYKDENTCYKCQENYVLNPLSKECTLIQTQANCQLYSVPFSCSACSSDFTLLRNYYLLHIEDYYQSIASADFMSKNHFQDSSLNLPFCKWTYQIENCFDYNSQGQCIKCLDGYYLSLLSDQPSISLNNRSFLSLNLAELTVPENELSNEYTTLYNSYWNSYSKVLESELIGSSCVENPKTKLSQQSGIPNCFIPEKSRCNLCYNNYYLDANLYCQKHENIVENCFVMSQKFKNSCLVCNPGYFLKESSSNLNINLCEQRINNFIPFCIDYSLNSDTCSECKIPKIIHNNGLSCSDPIPHCNTHRTTDSTLSCQTCDTNYLYNSGTNSCDPKDDNCISRAIDGNCVKCKEGFYLNASLACISVNPFWLNSTECKSSKLVTVNNSLSQDHSHLTCLDCFSGYFRKLFVNQCVLNAPLPISHCRTYDSNQDCLSCVSGYYLNVSGQCQSGSITGCHHYKSQSECSSCLQDYLLVSGQCLSFSNTEIENGLFSGSISCLKWTISNNSVSCDVCEPNHVVKREIEELVFTECIQDGTESPSIANCINEDISVQENNQGSTKCAECEDNFYKNTGDLALGLGTSCLPACAGDEMPDSVLKTCQKKIAQFPINNCSHGNGRSLCYKCQNGYKPQYNLNFFHQSLFLWSPDHHSGQNQVTQKEKYEPFIEECINNSDNEIDYFFEIQGNSFEYIPYKSLTKINGVTKNVTIKNCDTSSSVVFEEGDLNFALSCHKCNFDPFNKMMLTIVPVDLPLQDVQLLDTSLLEFDGDTPDLATSNMPYLSCHTQLILNEDSSGTESDLRFCYVQFYDIFQEKFICKVCNPGYKIISCQKISNCEVIETPGICDKCSQNYVFSSFQPEEQLQEFTNQTRDSQINRTECIYFGNNSTNVLAVDGTTPVACTSKSRLDFLTKTCVPLISDEGDAQKNCRGYANENCIQCSPGYWMKFKHKNIQKCTLAEDLSLRNSGCAIFKNTVFNDPDTVFSGSIECLECYSGFILNPVNDTCLDIKGIFNCQDYNITDPNNIKCNVCQPGYEINADSLCDKKTSQRPDDTIPNCVFLDDEFNCALCKNKYYLVRQFDYSLQKSTTICQKIPLPENCEEIDMDILKTEGKIFCNRCKVNYAPDFHLQNEILSTCQKTDGFENCHILEGKSCIECDLEYYLNNQNECQKRINIDSTCLEYHKDQDNCKTLFSISSNNVEQTDAEIVSSNIYIGLTNAALFGIVKDLPVLVNLPEPEDPENSIVYDGVDFCEKYLDGTRCLICKSRYYLNVLKNQCFPVTQTVSNCLYYSNGTTCFECEKDYLLINNSCFKITNFTCAVHENESSCKSCPKERPILDSNKNCVAPNNVEDCLNFNLNSSTGGYECTQCEKYFFLKEGRCQPIGKQIDKCEYYSEENVCKRCQPGYFFNPSNAQCEIATDFEGNCYEYQSGSQCTACSQGYYMDTSGSCLRCNASDCAYCDPLNSSQCLSCLSGFYMNTSGACVQ